MVDSSKYSNIAISILLLLGIGYIYDKYKINVDKDDKKHELDLIKKYLLNDKDYFTIEQLASINKPILWVHIPHDKNCREWESFGSRNSVDLNQDYLYLTIRTIINQNSDFFHVILIDDESFSKLLSDWTIDLSKIPDPQREYIRRLALVKVMYTYGGMLVDPGFILFKSLKPVYEKVLNTGVPCVAEFGNSNINSHMMNFAPSIKLMGCIKNCQEIYKFGKHLELIANQDYTNNSNIEGQVSNWLFNLTQEEKMSYIDGKYIGTKCSKNKLIDLDKLLGSTYLDLNSNAYGLYIPREDILKRNAYSWFVYLKAEEVLESNTNIGKYLLLSNNQ